MQTQKNNLSNNELNIIPSAEDISVGIVVAEWNKEITDALYEGAFNTLIEYGAHEELIEKYSVPGTFELTFGAKALIENKLPDVVIVLGCVIKGETPHFDYICQGVTNGITQLNTIGDIPVIFGVLTTNNLEQAKERAGGKYGNKGSEAAISAIKMAALNDVLLDEYSEYDEEGNFIGDEDYDDSDVF